VKSVRVDVKPHPIEMEEALEVRIRRSQTGFSRGDDEMGEGCSAVPRLGQPQRHVISSIRNQLRGRAQYSWETLNEAANFCLTHKTNLEDGLKWADFINPD